MALRTPMPESPQHWFHVIAWALLGVIVAGHQHSAVSTAKCKPYAVPLMWMDPDRVHQPQVVDCKEKSVVTEACCAA